MKGLYRVTFEVECDEDVIEKYLNHKRWANMPKSFRRDFIPKFMTRHIEAGFCRVKLPLAPIQRPLDWVFKFGRKGIDGCKVVRIGESEY
jgi:hypothetical protein